jgi:hypothetical protein
LAPLARVGAVQSDITEDLDWCLLMREVGRYLAAVDAFRAEGREPHWRPERVPEVLPVAASALHASARIP